jgi:pyrimidine operon attenuation protein/uracil phosphoribosyltransferase
MILLDKKRIQRTIKRISYQILEEAGNKKISLIGLNERGFSIARKIKDNLDKATESHLSLKQLNSEDDSTLQLSYKKVQNSALFIIDDVIFSGGTMFRSIQKIKELSAFEKVFVVVLVDRGHRKYPILASIVGVDAPTKLNEQVELRLKNGAPNEVILIEK